MSETYDDRNKALLADLTAAGHDVLSLASRHGLSLAELVDWAGQSQTRRTLAGLCVLADVQSQLLLSRYRLVAATRLIAQVTAEADTLSPEQVRKACVDLLKIELARAAQLSQDDAADVDTEFAELSRALSAGAVDDVDADEHEDTEAQ